MPKFKTRDEYEQWKSSKLKQKPGQKREEDTLALHLREQKIVKEINTLSQEGKELVEILEIIND